MINYVYRPVFDCTPGDIIKDEIDAVGMTQKELAERMGVSAKTITMLIKHKSPITPDYAVSLSRILGYSSDFWLDLEKTHQESELRRQENEELKKYKSFIAQYRYTELKKERHVRIAFTVEDKIRELMELFRVGTPAAIPRIQANKMASYREMETKTATNEAKFSWLTAGERIADLAYIESEYDKRLFVETLKFIRATMLDKPIDGKELKAMCAKAGVALVFLKGFKGLGVFGAAHWYNKRPIIQLTCAYTYDRFWFYFFHEAAHILAEDNKKGVFISTSNDENDNAEQLANNQAEHWILPNFDAQAFASEGLSIDRIQAFAAEHSVHPCILIGRLKKEGFIQQNHHNKLYPDVNVKLDALYEEEG